MPIDHLSEDRGGAGRIRANLWLRRGAQIAILLIVGAFWWAFVDGQELRRQRAEMMQHPRKPYVINGLQLDLNRHVTPHFERRGPSSRYLVLVSSDGCPKSHQMLAAWQTLLSTVPFRSEDSVILLTVAGDTIPSQLRDTLARRGIPHQTLRVDDVNAFAETTSVDWTPAILALDERLRVRLIAPRYDDAVTRAVHRFFERRGQFGKTQESTT